MSKKIKMILLVLMATMVLYVGISSFNVRSDKKTMKEPIKEQEVNIEDVKDKPSVLTLEEEIIIEKDTTSTQYILSELSKLDTLVPTKNYYRYENLDCSVFPQLESSDKINYIAVISKDKKSPNYTTLNAVLEILGIADNKKVIDRITEVLEYKNGDISEYEELVVDNIAITTGNTLSDYKGIYFTVIYGKSE